MTSQARVIANRRNAAKSTGPRIQRGKAIVAQNAIKHGLLARQELIAGEDPQGFALCRDKLLGEPAPVGHTETLLAERYQNQLFDYLLAKELQDPLNESDDMLSEEEVREMTSDPETDPGLAIGRVLAGDYSNGKVLDRLTVQERRIENSLYRTMKELRLARKQGTAGDPELTSDSVKQSQRSCRTGGGHSPPCNRAAECAKQSQLPAPGVSQALTDPAKQSQSSAEGQPHGQQVAHRTTAEPLAQESTPGDSGLPCETKPTVAGGAVWSAHVRVFAEMQDVASLRSLGATERACFAMNAVARRRFVGSFGP